MVLSSSVYIAATICENRKPRKRLSKTRLMMMVMATTTTILMTAMATMTTMMTMTTTMMMVIKMMMVRNDDANAMVVIDAMGYTR